MTDTHTEHHAAVSTGSLYRSEDMLYIRLLMTDDVAYDTVKQLGAYGKLHAVDISRHHTDGTGDLSDRLIAYKKKVQNSNYYEKKLMSFHAAFQEYHITTPSIDVQPQPIPADNADVLEYVRSVVEPTESQFVSNVLFKKQQLNQINNLLELLAILNFLQQQHIEAGGADAGSASQYGSLDDGGSSNGDKQRLIDKLKKDDKFDQLRPMREEMQKRQRGKQSQQQADDDDVESQRMSSYQTSEHLTTTITGVIGADKISLLMRMIFRLSRGNAVISTTDIDEPLYDSNSQQYVNKVAFVIVTMGSHLVSRINKLCVHLGADMHIVDNTTPYNRQIADIEARLTELRSVLEETESAIQSVLQSFALNEKDQTSEWLNLLHAIRQEIAICDILRQCGTESNTSRMLILEGYIPTTDISELRAALHGAVKHTKLRQAVLQLLPGHASQHTIPTYLKTNKFTGSFQAIVDTYGTPRYKEINPGLFTIITFPFLFGVMYGDIGHGFIIFVAALMMVLFEKPLQRASDTGTLGEIPRMVFAGRYLLLMMGAFATYCGLIYNDCFSIPFNLFGSTYAFDSPHSSSHSHDRHSHHRATKDDESALEGHKIHGAGVYPFGIDPSWYHTSNSLAFFNSFKMKLSVTLGVTQMTFGLVLSLLNHLHEYDYVNVVLEFIPRLVFLMSTFGYMIFICIYKMCIDWSKSDIQPPALVQTMIAMFLSPGNVDPDNELYPGQAMVQTVLLMMALGSVPVMLFGPPMVTNRKHKSIFGTSKSEETEQDSLHSHTPNGNGYHSLVNDDIEIETGSGSDTEERKDSGNGMSHRNVKSSKGFKDKREPAQHTPAHGSEHVEVHEEAAGGSHSEFDPHSKSYSFSDHLITNSIHTIEYVLGAVSNTASYLRLWALSLAHAELSDVFWSRMIMQYGIQTSNPYMIVVGFSVWLMATFAVLLCMDVLECFLHALRLHWVEFQNKFYHADGVPYTPFDTTYKSVQVQD